MSKSPKKPSRQDLLESQEKNPKQCIHWLEAQPEFTELQKIAASDDELKLPKPPLRQRIFKYLKDIFWTDESALYGRSCVDPNLINEAKTTATIVSTANLINVVTTYPYLEYAFVDMGGTGIALAVFVGILLNKISNAFGEAACRNRHRGEALTGWVGLVLINILLTLTAGPGVELLLDPQGLAERRSQELLQKVLDTSLQEQNLTQRQERANLAQANCQAILNDLKALPPKHPNRDLLYQQAYGTWGERNRDWNQVELTNLPLCRKASRLDEEAQAYADKIQAEREAKQTEIHRYGSGLLYLKAVHPDMYRINFDENSQLRSGLEASRLSLQGFAQKLSTGDVSELGFALFFFTVSLVTSGAAVAKVATFARRQDVLRSWNPTLYQLREELFYRVDKGIHQELHEPESQETSVPLNGNVPIDKASGRELGKLE
jgi:hypothetical protein